ncbi:MAG: DUF2520 domain-containing protein [Thermoleophilia bacterium]|nr:DUF2520 domain-containing protein [Thermoleophilia bacterium]
MHDLELGPLRVGIIGAGSVGCALGLALQHAGLEVVHATARTPEGRERAAHKLKVPVSASAADAAISCDLVVICTPDDAIADVARELSTHLASEDVSHMRFVHTSGCVPLAALEPLRALGATVLSVHPLQTLTRRATANDLRGAAAAVTAEDMAGEVFGHALAHAADMHPFNLADEHRVAYHAASSFAANFTVTLMSAVEELSAIAQIPEGVARAAFAQLARTAIDRVEHDGAGAALTGPIVRGDTQTVVAHLAALDQLDMWHAQTYRNMAAATVHLAMSSGRLDVADAMAMGRVISGAATPPPPPPATVEEAPHAND